MTPVIEHLLELNVCTRSSLNRVRGQADARQYTKQPASLETEVDEALAHEIHGEVKELVDRYESSLKIDMRDLERKHAKELADLQSRHKFERSEVETFHDRDWFAEIKTDSAKIKDDYERGMRNAVIASIEAGDTDVLWEWEREEAKRRVAEEKRQDEERRLEEAEVELVA